MRRGILATFTGCALALSMLAGGTTAMAMAAEGDVEAAIERYQEQFGELRRSGGLTGETVQEIADEAVEGLDIASLSIEQIAALNDERILTYTTKRDGFVTRLRELANDRGVDGARAAAIHLSLVAFALAEDEERADAIRLAAEHPGLHDALRQGHASDIFFTISRMSDESLKKARTAVLSLDRVLTDDLPVETAAGLAGLQEAVIKTTDDRRTRERVHGRINQAMRSALERADARQSGRLERELTFIDGAYARGELMNKPAPAMNITWSSDSDITSLEDLKGNVVVFDFWATWCGPCITSFPQVRELVENYEGYPVKVIGVTSLQGAHFGPDGRVDTSDDADKEYSLMPSFMEHHEMTWPVVFTEQEVFNPDYGVRGIPHVAILDPAGKVRYRGLHPASDPEGKRDKINGLLKEFDLPKPE
ncbi:MAG: TlpA family protein disulfide reductase [Phycisphaeraceae bacterium]|nr:MAG: TlpA family protein disulfide reductase [Phycisphaeraceae bacterium]